MDFKQKHFRKVPKKVTAKVNSFKSDTILVSVETTLSKELLVKFRSSSLFATSQDQTDELGDFLFLPPKNVGTYSKRNIEGRSITLRNMPKVTKSWTIEGPNFGDYTKGTHTVVHSKLVFPKKTEFPKNILLSFKIIKRVDNNFRCKVLIDVPLNRTDSTFNQDLLFFINLLQENLHEIDVISTNTDENLNTVDVDWELLPVGTSDIKKIISSKVKPSFQNEKDTQDRIDFFADNSFHVKSYINGKNSFNRYFGMILTNQYVILEDFHYGNALYIFKKDWETFSQKSRLDLIHLDDTSIERVIHNKNWKNRVNDILKS